MKDQNLNESIRENASNFRLVQLLKFIYVIYTRIGNENFNLLGVH